MVRLNNYEPGILAGADAPGCVLARLTRASEGAVPLWGQRSSFIIERRAMRVRIELEGMFGIGARFMSWLGLGAHAVDWDKPFLSETGYRSFLGVGGGLRPAIRRKASAARSSRLMLPARVSSAPSIRDTGRDYPDKWVSV